MLTISNILIGIAIVVSISTIIILIITMINHDDSYLQ